MSRSQQWAGNQANRSMCSREPPLPQPATRHRTWLFEEILCTDTEEKLHAYDHCKDVGLGQDEEGKEKLSKSTGSDTISDQSNGLSFFCGLHFQVPACLHGNNEQIS